jgi:flagellar basal-body rod protein FlgC
MDIFSSFDVSASALKAQTIRLNTISSNLANVDTTSTPEGGPYKKKSVYFQSKPLSFRDELDNNLQGSVQGVEVTKIIEDKDPPRKVYDPSNPEADKNGYVSMPNISVLKEMVDMMSATRSYEANVTAIQSEKRMVLKAIDIGS